MVRAVEPTTIFRADRHGADIVARLAGLGKQGALTVPAWVLFSNRFASPDPLWAADPDRGYAYLDLAVVYRV